MKTEEKQTFTYQTRITLGAHELQALDDYARLFSSVTHGFSLI